MNRNCIVRADRLLIPDRLVDLVDGEDFSGVFGQQQKNVVLDRSQFDGLIIDKYFLGVIVDGESAAFVNENPSDAAQLVASYGIVEKAPVAEKALPKCNITYLDGEDMKTALSGYLDVLFEQNPDSVGGALPEDDFYYMPADDAAVSQ